MDTIDYFIKETLKNMQELGKLENDILKLKQEIEEDKKDLKRNVANLEFLTENAYSILTKFEREFEKETELDKNDGQIVLFFTSLQIMRQFLLETIFDKELFSLKGKELRIDHNDKLMKKSIESKKEESYLYQLTQTSKVNSTKYRTTQKILSSPSVPYDATRGAKKFNENLGGGNYHRAKTLGHDPILGWIFGVFNILTDTVTLSNFNTYRVNMNGLVFEEQVSTFVIFKEGLESIQEDPSRLVASILVHSLHLESDITTKAGLPVPLITIFEDLQYEIYKRYDWLCFKRDLKIIGSQFLFSKIIDFILIIYREIEYKNFKVDKRIYQAKTQKMILLSNTIASSTNIVKTLLTGQLYSLDMGGILNTLINFFAVLDKLSNLKQDYMFDNFRKLLMLEGE